jgi:hypothetical protein
VRDEASAETGLPTLRAQARELGQDAEKLCQLPTLVDALHIIRLDPSYDLLRAAHNRYGHALRAAQKHNKWMFGVDLEVMDAIQRVKAKTSAALLALVGGGPGAQVMKEWMETFAKSRTAPTGPTAAAEPAAKDKSTAGVATLNSSGLPPVPPNAPKEVRDKMAEMRERIEAVKRKAEEARKQSGARPTP